MSHLMAGFGSIETSWHYETKFPQDKYKGACKVHFSKGDLAFYTETSEVCRDR